MSHRHLGPDCSVYEPLAPVTWTFGRNTTVLSGGLQVSYLLTFQFTPSFQKKIKPHIIALFLLSASSESFSVNAALRSGEGARQIETPLRYTNDVTLCDHWDISLYNAAVPSRKNISKKEKALLRMYERSQFFLELPAVSEGQNMGNIQNIAKFDGSGARSQYLPLSISLRFCNWL
jgi:hypothetical protein